MDFHLTEEQLQLKESAEAFGKKEIFPSVLERDEKHLWNPDLFFKMGEQGLLGAPFPEEYGGTGLKCLDTCIVKQGFAKGTE